MKKTFTKALLLLATSTFCACGSAPIKAVYLSDQRNIWIEDANSGLQYCVSANGDKVIDPVCFQARKSTEKDIRLVGVNLGEVLPGAREAKEAEVLPGAKETKETKKSKE
ncbi:MAG: hypothetical protein ABIQ95_00405 [Bdellovibrionia bacterium]